MGDITVVDSIESKNWYSEDDYYTLKRFLESKQKVKEIFANPQRSKELKEFMQKKETVKDEMKKITEDESYAKGLGL